MITKHLKKTFQNLGMKKLLDQLSDNLKAFVIGSALIALALAIVAIWGCGKEPLPVKPRVTINSVQLTAISDRVYDSIPGEESPDLTLHVYADSFIVYTNTLITNCHRLPVALMPTDETYPTWKPVKFIVLDVDATGADTVAVFDFIGQGMSRGCNQVYLNDGDARLLIGCKVVY